MDFTSLGAFNPSSDVAIDVGSGQMSGGASFAGVTLAKGGINLLVFTFSSFTLDSGVSITINFDSQSTAGVALISKGDMNIDGDIDADGAVGGAGQFANGLGAGSNGSVGTFGGEGGSGGGYGGVGGSGQGNPSSSGVTYNPDLTDQLAAGSGGGTGGESGGGSGGAGGGALQIVSLSTLTATGTISADGGQGAKGQLSGNSPGGSGGGGSGGGILLQAVNMNLTAGAALSASGGNGGPAYVAPIGFFNLGGGGGGGGGGRINVVYLSSAVANGSINVSGANSGYGFSGNGAPGTVDFEQNSLVPAVPTITASRDASGEIVLSWPAFATNYTLQSSAVLGTQAAWTTVGSGVVVGDHLVLTNQTSGAAGFFRLIAP